MAGFFRHSAVEDDLKLEIAEFVRKRVHVVAHDGVRDLVSLFDRVGRDRFEGLHHVHSQPLTGSRRQRMISTRRSRDIDFLYKLEV